MSCPTRHQWLVLRTLRDGPTKRLGGHGNLRTKISVKRRGWVEYDEQALHYNLTADGREALAAGDRRYLANEIAYARRSL